MQPVALGSFKGLRTGINLLGSARDDGVCIEAAIMEGDSKTMYLLSFGTGGAPRALALQNAEGWD